MHFEVLNKDKNSYANDNVLLSDSCEELQVLLDKVVSEHKKRGFSINCKRQHALLSAKSQIYQSIVNNAKTC